LILGEYPRQKIKQGVKVTKEIWRATRLHVSAFIVVIGSIYGAGQTAAQVRDPAILELQAYAKSLVQKYPRQLADVGNIKQTMRDPMAAYITPFIARDPELRTKPVTPGASKTLEANEKKTAQWDAIYCTDELRDILKKYRIFSASAQLYDEDGQRGSLSSCLRKTNR
jgi:hypothetical protein